MRFPLSILINDLKRTIKENKQKVFVFDKERQTISKQDQLIKIPNGKKISNDNFENDRSTIE